MKSIIYIGMDVHKNTYSLCGINSSTGEVIAQTKCAAEVKNILKFIKSAKRKACDEDETDILTGYVSGWLGFYLYHELAYHDILCVILATLALSTHGSYKAIHVPTDMTMKLRNI